MTIPSRFYRPAFLVVLAFYCFFFSRFGFENWDTGFVSAQSWRIVNGQKPFADFLSIRPPVTAYFHAAIMKLLPDFGEVYFTRLIGYLLFALQVFFVVSGLDKLFRLSRYRISKWGAMLVGFVLATGAIYPDPWFTVDGIFFASAAFYLLARFKNPDEFAIAGVALLCLLSAGTKQSFYFVPILFGIWILVCHGRVKAFWFGIATIVLLAIFSVYVMRSVSIFTVFDQLKTTGNRGGLFQLGIMAYLNAFGTKYVWMALALLSFGFAFINSGNRMPSAVSWLKWLSMAVLLSALVAIPVLGFNAASSILTVAVLVAFARKTKGDFRRIKRYFALLVLVGVAWCAGLSNGFPYPVLYCHALVFAYFILMHDDFGDYRLDRLYVFFSVPVCVFLFVGNFSRYREQSFPNLTADMGKVSNKLAFIRSSENTFRKLSELRQLKEKYEGAYAVAPSLPQAYYLLNDINRLPVDWLSTFELQGWGKLLPSTIPLTTDYVFVERSFFNGEPFVENDKKRREFSAFAYDLHKRYRPIDKTENWFVYDASDFLNIRIKYPAKTAK